MSHQWKIFTNFDFSKCLPYSKLFRMKSFRIKITFRILILAKTSNLWFLGTYSIFCESYSDIIYKIDPFHLVFAQMKILRIIFILKIFILNNFDKHFEKTKLVEIFVHGWKKLHFGPLWVDKGRCIGFRQTIVGEVSDGQNGTKISKIGVVHRKANFHR